MDAMTIDDARKDLDRLMDQAADNAEPIIITRTGKSAAVLLSLDEWNSIQAMLDLVRSPANRDLHLVSNSCSTALPASAS